MSKCPTCGVNKAATIKSASRLIAENERLSRLLETANAYGAGENAARLKAEAEIERLRAELGRVSEKLMIAGTDNAGLRAERDALLRLLGDCREQLEFWTPDETMIAVNEVKPMDRYYALRDRIDAARRER